MEGDAGMPSLTLDEQLIYFAHCPKAGGTSVEQFMVARWGDRVGHLGWGWDREWSGRGGERAGGIPSSPQHYTWHDAARVLPRQPDAVFAVVRDPVARMISEYRYQQTERRKGRLAWPLQGLGFSTWLHLMAEVHARNPYVFDNHFRPQGEFVPDGATVFRLEDGLGQVGTWLCAQAGEAGPVAMPHELKAGSRIPPVQPARQDLDLISSWFSGDFQRFGYRFPLVTEAPADRHAGSRRAFARTVAPIVDTLYRRGRI
jgi:hypothetical protein